jgi:hypothetical protein
MRILKAGYISALPLLLIGISAHAYDINDMFSISGVIAGAGQCQNVSDTGSDDDVCRGAVPFQTEVDFRPDDANEFFFKLGYASGNGLNTVTPFNVAPWAVDLEDDVININGSNRDYLLAAWYKYTNTYGEDNSVGVTFGILDSTAYIDGNEYANDEFTQFMNEAFVNSGSYGLPSYDTGAAVEWATGSWSVNALGMNVNENDDGNNFNYFAGQLGYHTETSMGDGNYRLIVASTNTRFLNPAGTQLEDRLAYGLSFDQAFGNVFGGFLRFAWQTDDAAVDYKAIYSGGLNIAGQGWGRDDDNIGLGYAYMQGGNTGVDGSQVAEAYYRIQLNDALGVTADIQYISDKYEPTTQTLNPKGWIVGFRATAEF